MADVKFGKVFLILLLIHFSPRASISHHVNPSSANISVSGNIKEMSYESMGVVNKWLIVGGKMGNIMHYPYQVSISNVPYNNPTQVFICGGSIISQNHVLTAAHCVMDSNSKVVPYENIFLRFGSDKVASGGSHALVSDVCIHPLFTQHNRYLKGYNLALVKVMQKFTFNKTTSPLRLPWMDDKASLTQTVKNCSISGFGLTQGNKVSPSLVTSELILIDDESCKKELEMKVSLDNLLCASGRGGQTGLCAGDSGSGLVCSAGEGNKTIWGVATFVDKCTNGAPVLFTRVDNQKDFIQHCMKLSALNVSVRLRPYQLLRQTFVIVFLIRKHLLPHSLGLLALVRSV